MYEKRVIQILIWFEIVIVAPLLFLSFWVLSVLFYFCSKMLDFFKHGINVAVCLRSKFALSDKKRNLAKKKSVVLLDMRSWGSYQMVQYFF